MNIINLVGNLGKDVVFSEKEGEKTAKTSLATNEYYTDNNSVKQQNTDWHNLVFKGNLAETISKFAKKGSLISITGKYRSVRNGDKVYNYVQVTEYQLLGESQKE